MPVPPAANAGRVLDPASSWPDAPSMEQSTACAACSAPVGAEELAQGLAVRVSGRLLCPLCLDRLPGDAKVMVNQMRALRGMAVTTYRYYSGRHPRLPLYTFTTANLILAHRRKLVHGEEFTAPPLPPPGSRPRLPTASEAGRGDRTGWMAVWGIAILVVTGVVWLVVPTGAPKKTTPPVETAPIETVAPVTPSVDPPVRSDAVVLTELERRLRDKPGEARAIADEAELLRDRLAPREVGLRNRADALVRDAMAAADRLVVPLVPAPVQLPAPKPDPTPAVPLVAPAPAPAPVPVPVPVPDTGKPPTVTVTPTPPPTPTVTAPDPPAPKVGSAKPPAGAMPCDIQVLFPKDGKALVEAGGLPQRKDLPWPWPSGEAILAPALDPKAKPRRLAIELRLPGAAAPGGATIVIHPGKAERSTLVALWSDGTSTTAPLTIACDGVRWQAIAVPASGSEGFDQALLRLRLEDVKDLGDQRPFLVAGASSRSDAAPAVTDHPVALPILLPPALVAKTTGWSDFRILFRKLADAQLKSRQFSFAKSKILLPLPKNQVAYFRADVRDELRALLGVESLANGNPADLPDASPEFAKSTASWPIEGMDDLDRYEVLAFGWRAQAWGDEADLVQRVELVLAKMLTADRKLARPAIVPVLVIGEVDRATQAEQVDIDRRWKALAERVSAKGVPVIDLRAAQAGRDTIAIQRRAARILADGLRQLDWMLKL